jgi:hypothetical protein
VGFIAFLSNNNIMEYIIDVKNLFINIEQGASIRDLTNFEIQALADYVITEGMNYDLLPDGLKFKTSFATECRNRGVILPDIVMYYCFN